MKYPAFVLPLIASASAVFFNMTRSPAAEAYSVDFSSGKPVLGINSGDVGRSLDPTTFELSAGATSRSGSKGTQTLSKDLLAKAVMTVVGFTDNELNLSIRVDNNTENTNLRYSVVSLWFAVSEKITGIDITNEVGDPFQFAGAPTNNQGNTPGGFKDIDVCIFSGQSCSGGSIKKGLLVGGTGVQTPSDTFLLTLNGEFGAVGSGNGKATIQDFGVKFRSDEGSYKVAGVPEPITILGSGAALVFGAVMKRRASQKDMN